MYKLQIIINCGPCEHFIRTCLQSIKTQSYVDWAAFVSIDPSGDSTYACAVDVARDDPRINLTLNPERKFAMENLVRGISRSNAQRDDIIVVLDGDDWFQSNRALEKIVETYLTSDCWMTYGSWVSNVAEMPGLWPAYPEGTTNFRQVRWLATAVRSWKKWLWDLIDDRDLRDDQGAYFRVAEDMASMFPMLEMSGTNRARHISEPLMLYNNANPAGAARVHREEMRRNARLIRSRPPYPQLEPKGFL